MGGCTEGFGLTNTADSFYAIKKLVYDEKKLTLEEVKGYNDEFAKKVVKTEVNELQDSATVVMELRSQFPETGIPGKIYVAMKEATTYVWYNGDYLPVGDGGYVA